MLRLKHIIPIFFILLMSTSAFASKILINMDESQKNHLKGYGLAYWILANGVEVEWLLNYKGGSFAFAYNKTFENECLIRGVSYEVLADAQYNSIVSQIMDPEVNMDVMKLEKAPKIAVYSPKSKQPWDDAVTMVLTYAEIPYDMVYDDEVLNGELLTYDWLHLHHEDFTGQDGKFYRAYSSYPWYQNQVREFETSAKKHGFSKVSELKLAVVHGIREYVAGGGFLFAMCSATDTYDIALAAENTDICASVFDHDPVAPDAQKKLDYSKSFAFQDFNVIMDPLQYEHSDIDATRSRRVSQATDYFTLFEFSAKWDPIPTMLTQCHTRVVKGFMGQTTAFRKEVIKPTVLIMGENKAANEARYIHSEFGRGFFTFYGGHDPEDYQHFVGDPPTDLNLHPQSPGYRLILNNILFPAAKQKKRKT